MTSATSATRKSKTRVQEVYTLVRQDILRGTLHPGEKLSPSAIATDFGVSLSVVREALTRLAEQGLVVSQPQIGFTVTPISREDLLDLTSVRLDIETLAVRRSVENGDVEWRTALVAAHYRLEQTPQYDTDLDPPVIREDWAAAHKVFHDVLLSACGSKRLLEIAENLRDSAELYRRWSAPIGGEYTRDIIGEHRGIFDAAQTGDADAAVAGLTEHISHTTRVLLTHAT
jgi:DNA-binding GntR family transcriptional regulator